MNANELADELESRMPAGYWTPPELLAEAATMLRQQQAEIDFLKKEILAKHEDWKHEGQQAANARAEIDALRMMLTNRNDALDRLDLKSTPCKYTEGM